MIPNHMNGRCRDGGDSTVYCADKKAGGYMLPVFFYWEKEQVQNLALTAVDNRRGMQ